MHNPWGLGGGGRGIFSLYLLNISPAFLLQKLFGDLLSSPIT